MLRAILDIQKSHIQVEGLSKEQLLSKALQVDEADEGMEDCLDVFEVVDNPTIVSTHPRETVKLQQFHPGFHSNSAAPLSKGASSERDELAATGVVEVEVKAIGVEAAATGVVEVEVKAIRVEEVMEVAEVTEEVVEDVQVVEDVEVVEDV